MTAGTTSRAYRGHDDLAAMQALVSDAWRAGGAKTATHVGDLDWWYASPGATGSDLEGRIRLWHGSGSLAGWAWAGKHSLDLCLASAYRDGALYAEMLDWYLARDDAKGVWALDTDGAAIAELRRRGLRPTGHAYEHHQLELAGRPREPAPPSGFTCRPFRGEEEIEARVDVHRAAFDPSRMTVDRHRLAMTGNYYRTDLDLVVEAPDAQLVAFCIVWLDGANRVGEFEPVGTRPSHQRRGLGRAVVGEGLRLLRQLGAERAIVTCEAGNAASCGLYRGLGFQPDLRSVEYAKD